MNLKLHNYITFEFMTQIKIKKLGLNIFMLFLI
jgi:hypothetical protein